MILPSVSVRFDGGAPIACTTGLSRDDVAGVLRDDRLRTSGWSFAHPVKSLDVFVEVAAQTSAGEEALLYAGPLTHARVARDVVEGEPPPQVAKRTFWQRLRGLARGA